jgi:hypothetical protein
VQKLGQLQSRSLEVWKFGLVQWQQPGAHHSKRASNSFSRTSTITGRHYMEIEWQ